MRLEIAAPLAECSECRFTTALSGEFSVEDGRLVWRGDALLQPRRGPDLGWCCETEHPRTGDECTGVDYEDGPMHPADYYALRHTNDVAEDNG